ncbi:MAG: SDR family NAD(P)-dependent oxidoreductase [Methylobacteriaceae bacterium]|nr:SDR family NAD(P)-dependent oxidoreductase [Methylobacteriaceae bacterium]MBV9220804.1 SDR family NAD(P)-dependent oxidoreductase [Methylobacteriaceae bacterium]MBV9246081.1 SDR family NAD(P)-dependent oxidoreductase [Methylobacteriaceae bacterium]MBV9635676.1 SDR family NAD(P)-dependent oxidoreductase [Methylobacteriaceae bacterium]MBV9704707.1 SDR family NAD(P)-dependent oxidoreductase [Methylobacteriaceae bacterium]
MSADTQPVALIVGAGDGLSASLARLLVGENFRLDLAARNIDKLAALKEETGARLHRCDAADPAAVASLFEAVGERIDVVVYNPSYRVQGPIVDIAPAEVRKTLDITAFGGFLVGQQAARRMLAAGRGTILFTGASASVKGYANSAPFAMGKFALRGLAQSMARELHPQGIHIAHIVIDGGIRSSRRPDAGGRDAMLDPDAIAATCLDLIRQPRSNWSWEIEVRPWLETF